jgi:hypothetical protein
MKVLDILLIICAIVLLAISYYVYSLGNAELGALVSFCAVVCGVTFGARWGERLHKKNQENK